ncbi:TPA: exo-alpha-sialidase [Acinetobacter baumannii]|nr:exo-alpha-sialidase [Acinetobacter baumannii]
MATALTSQFTRFTDKCNQVLAGGVVKTYEPNSLIPKVSYQDPLATIPNLPEVTLDATGRAKIYLLGDYRIQVYSCDGVLIEDNLFVEQGFAQSDLNIVKTQFQGQIDESVSLETERATTAEQQLRLEISTSNAGIKYFSTEAALLAFVPGTTDPKQAYAFDTKKNYLWALKSGSTTEYEWKDEGISVLDLANNNADAKDLRTVQNNIPLLPATQSAFIWEIAKRQVLMNLSSDGTLNVGEVATNALKRGEGGELAHAITTKSGLILFGVRTDGTLYYKKNLVDKYLPQVSYRSYLEIDKSNNKTVLPYFFETVVAPYGTDGKLHQRMPAAIKVANNKLFFSFTQFNTANTDASNGRLVGRFVTYDLDAKTISVDPTTVVMYDSGNTAIASRHPNLIQLQDGRYMCLFNSTLSAGSAKSPLYAIYSTDCVTWSAPVLKLADNNDALCFTISATIQRIHTGKYKDRLIIPVYNTNYEVCIMYSDDEGETWKMGQKWSGASFGDSTLQTNETSVVVDIDGSVIAHSRTEKNSTGNRFFYVVKSTDGGETIDVIGKLSDFPTTNCAIGIAQAAQQFNNGIPKIIASRPTSPEHFVRNKFMISASYDGMQTASFNYKPYPDSENVGYTHLLALDDQNFVLSMERGTDINNGNNYVAVAFFNMARIMKND